MPELNEQQSVSDETGAGQQAQDTRKTGSIPPEHAEGEARTEDAGPQTPSLTPEETIARLEGRLAEEHDMYLRKAADFENFRKRSLKEKQEAIDFANQNLLSDLIPILDDFERALKAAETAQKTEADFDTLKNGINMIEKRLVTQLENKWSLKRFDSAGEPFNPEKHEALMMEKSADVSEAVVQEEFTKGYTLKERVIRPAKVKVLMPETNT